MVPINDPSEYISTFISYTHDNEGHRKWVLDLSDRLVEDGIDCWCDQYVEGSTPAEGWPAWMETKVRLSKYVLVVCTEKYLNRFEGRELAGKGLGAKFESVLIKAGIYRNDAINLKFIPVIVSNDHKVFIPQLLDSYTHYCLDSDQNYESLYRRLTGQYEVIRPAVGKIKKLPIATKYTSTHTNSISRIDEAVTISDKLTLPDIPEFYEAMNANLKIAQAFLRKPVTWRFATARNLGLLQEGEPDNSTNKDKLSAKILVRAQDQHLLGDLWSRLFNESIDPNPFR